MSVKIIVDSTADLTDDIKSQMEVVPLTLRFGEEEYIDGVIIVQNLRGKGIIIDKNILNPVVGEYTEFGAQIGGKTHKRKSRKSCRLLIQFHNNNQQAEGKFPPPYFLSKCNSFF